MIIRLWLSAERDMVAVQEADGSITVTDLTADCADQSANACAVGTYGGDSLDDGWIEIPLSFDGLTAELGALAARLDGKSEKAKAQSSRPNTPVVSASWLGRASGFTYAADLVRTRLAELRQEGSK